MKNQLPGNKLYAPHRDSCQGRGRGGWGGLRPDPALEGPQWTREILPPGSGPQGASLGMLGGAGEIQKSPGMEKNEKKSKTDGTSGIHLKIHFLTKGFSWDFAFCG